MIVNNNVQPFDVIKNIDETNLSPNLVYQIEKNMKKVKKIYFNINNNMLSSKKPGFGYDLLVYKNENSPTVKEIISQTQNLYPKLLEVFLKGENNDIDTTAPCLLTTGQFFNAFRYRQNDYNTI